MGERTGLSVQALAVAGRELGSRAKKGEQPAGVSVSCGREGSTLAHWAGWSSRGN